MPVYEYACKACGCEFEREQRITEDPLKTCPECKAPKARRLISRTSFVLKGGGWYSDLYGSAGKDSGADAGDAGGDAAATGDADKKKKKKKKPKKDEPTKKKDGDKPGKGSGGTTSKGSKAA